MKNSSVTIPEDCLPDSFVISDVTGGMPILVTDWHTLMYLFKMTNVPKLAYISISNNNILN